MQPSNFDELTKALATSTSRRHALRLIVTASIGGLFGLGGISTAFGRHQHRAKIAKPSPGGSPGNSKCAQFCAAVFGPNTPAANQCTSDAAHNKMGNLCQQCGGNAASICCEKTGGFCNGSITGATCCDSSHTCIDGSCCPNSNVCGTTCLTVSCDSSQCLTCDENQGACVSTCSSGQTCVSG